MPKELRDHVLNYLRFLLLYFIAEVLLATAHKFRLVEHYGLIQFGMAFLYFSVSAWFGWRFYTGMFRDGDFHLDE